ncbi:phosphomethylpyrimidine kinase [Gluconacetobacter diazotrophicus PA1 5]|uniref:hydroxymethylpyrimidine kinase n=2 Tax=Gluconacetobacter diazotrophicus TaxID=33996 RepID=A9HB23_GLUDA|nr:bifunctional hydroxymethylpyrimidine kinase/phosphomethylpyrimidine kinase [Gluconacetobacter diazotrophicus]ACI50987.1 phosphomethylpyrimidine kinase [Gluconacetobacter diazotrophicus PA1 5]MBB2156686.1 bifunctional hydroxymethylpyrimidine kinase/phosphomethylpyrimidine kinase [Gluconacetobacter diazotrophicus]TWB08558.1 hydroxymethylpyrimidine/phosphomethylpyrimidine kinase [Gluconacetobacter diazotrophicus]CAP54756.1 putative bifunctional thiED protein [Gluconacetobacter diazotrophicus PA
MKGRILVIAGSDSGGGAGIQADIKTITALGGFAMTALSALTVQNTLGVTGVLPVPPDFVAQQMCSVLDDLGADAFKSGMLDRAEVILAVADIIRVHPGIPYVLDPVMVAKGGSRLLQDNAVETLRRDLLPLATLLTPNLPEAEVLVGRPIRTVDDMRRAAEDLRRAGAGAVLVKGGHLDGDVLTDVLATDAGIELFSDTRLHTRHTHGTGCTLASAIATGLAQGLTLRDAVIRARRYLRAAIAAAPGYGAGAGPLNHAVTIGPDWTPAA